MFHARRKDDDSGWMSLSDMMTVLMVLFLIISVTIAVSATTSLQNMRSLVYYITEQEQILCEELEQNLQSEFQERDLQVECNPIRIIFTNPNYEFAKNSDTLTPAFERALSIFFPIYLDTIDRSELRDLIDEIRIEGHTDSDGDYIYNMSLSQDRARNVLSFAINLPKLNSTDQYFQWSRSLLTANGLSFSRRLNQDGKVMEFPYTGVENKDRSRRVEVKLRTKSKELLMALQNQI